MAESNTAGYQSDYFSNRFLRSNVQAHQNADNFTRSRMPSPTGPDSCIHARSRLPDSGAVSGSSRRTRGQPSSP